jgi:hypothetical protein
VYSGWHGFESRSDLFFSMFYLFSKTQEHCVGMSPGPVITSIQLESTCGTTGGIHDNA